MRGRMEARRGGKGNGRKLTDGNGIDFGISDGIFPAMKTTLTIDKAGRIILPKQIRDRMHLTAGSKLEAELIGSHLRISPEEEEDPPFEVVDGITVIKGGGPIPGGVAAAIRRERDAMAHRALRRS
jgi:AbrB family looped-hinge helix DNA binding protein